MRRPEDSRFTEPLYTVRNAAWFLRVPPQTLANWTYSSPGSAPLVASVPAAGRRMPEIPFIGLAEALVIRTLRRTDPHRISMQRIRKMVNKVKAEIGLENALASRRLYTDGVELFFDYASEDADYRELAEVLRQQYVMEHVVEGNLRVISFGEDGWAKKLMLPFVPDRELVRVSPQEAFGQPIFIHGGGRLQDVLTRFRVGEPLEDVARDFGVPVADVLDVLRGFVPEETA
jgi:uncharacterized protein (DUF433 family)